MTLVTLLIDVLILALVVYVLGLVIPEERPRRIVQTIVALICVLFLLDAIGLLPLGTVRFGR